MNCSSRIHELPLEPPWCCGWPGDAAYGWPLWRYEVVCRDCGAHFFMPDGECCLCCGGESLRTVSQDVLQLRMDAENGEVYCI